MKIEIFESFRKYYDKFYGHDDYGSELFKEEQAAIERFDNLYKENEIFRTLIVTLVQVREDVFSSDKEIASIMLAYEETAKTITKRFNDNNK